MLGYHGYEDTVAMDHGYELDTVVTDVAGCVAMEAGCVAMDAGRPCVVCAGHT